MTGKLAGKIAVVTGAASGIGLATTEALLAEGATVVMADRDEAALKALIKRLGDKAIPQITDLLDSDSCNAMVPEILAKVGHIDILHCNAGTYIGGDLVETDPATIDRMLNLNVNAVIKNVHAIIPHMTERGVGDIIITCSVAGNSAIPWEPVYSASKWAMTLLCPYDAPTAEQTRHPGRASKSRPRYLCAFGRLARRKLAQSKRRWGFDRTNRSIRGDCIYAHPHTNGHNTGHGRASHKF